MEANKMLSQGFTQLQTQKLNLTQSLAQSIQLLQFDIEELNKYLDEAALDNPFLVVRRRTYPVAAKMISLNNCPSHRNIRW